MDLPHLPDYTWKMVLNPLLEKEIIHLSKITWQVPKEAKPKDESDDDDYYSGTEPFFKLLALVLASVKEPDIAKYGKQWSKVINERRAHIEDADSLWSELEGLIGASKYAKIKPVIDAPE